MIKATITCLACRTTQVIDTDQPAIVKYDEGDGVEREVKLRDSMIWIKVKQCEDCKAPA